MKKMVEKVVFRARTFYKINGNFAYVKGSSFYQNDEGQAFIYGYDKNKKFNKIEIAVATLKVCHIFEAKE